MNVIIEKSWKERLENEFEKPYFKQVTDFVREEYRTKTIYPPAKLIFNAFDQCPFDKVKVVIVGQDPYHAPGQAHGLCFSVNEGVEIPPSLLNIYKEIHNDLGKPIPKSGNLERWCKQGVFLLNAILTVQAHRACSHQGKGWEEFTDAVIWHLANEREHLVFLLCIYAQRRRKYRSEQASHPKISPSFASLGKSGIFGNRHFSKTNEYLIAHGKTPIDW